MVKLTSFFKDLIIYSLDIATVLAGAKFRGDFEQRLKGILESVVKAKKEGKEIILFIDEIHTIMGAGATGSGTMDASNLLKPYLSSGKIKIIGSTTYEEYRKFIEKDAAFRRRFQKIDLDEPSSEESVKILQGIKGTLEDHHGIKISNKVIHAAVSLSKKYLFDKKLPDKAIDIIDEACSSKKLSHKSAKSLTIGDLEKVVSKLSGVPTQSINNDEKKVLKDLKKNLKLLIYGQDHAVDAICESILVSRSGLGNENKPIASFLFSGPTGVGKTELSKQLATLLGNQFIRFDMSEYMEKHSVSKLIGAPPGYVGHDQGGILTDKVNKNPYSVILLDEIEKAHPDIYNILLQVMDNGTLTDSMGRVTNFRNSILIFTTNAGAAESEKGVIGLGGALSVGTFKADKVLKNFFSPEFRNRLNGIVRFNSLDKDQMVKIVEKFIFEVQGRLESQGLSLDISNEVIQELAEIGFDPKMGARPLERCILEKISTPISKILIDLDDKKSKKMAIVRLVNKEITVSLE
jgi:ATP-dependent Clp protease ATP-binding subunit ClpA